MRTEDPLPTRRKVAVAAALFGLLIASCGRPPRGKPPASISRFPGDLASPQLELSGIYEDGWSAPAAALYLYQPDGKQVLVVRGMVPKIDREDFRTDFEVRLDQEVVARRSLGLGEFTLETPVPAKPGKRRIKLVFGASQQLPAGDDRAIGARLSFVGFERAKAAEQYPPADIVRGFGLQLGAGWGVLETFRNETFRWVENDAQILVTASKTGNAAVSLLVESGPGMGGPFLLKVLDGNGRQVNAARIAGRKSVELSLPVEAGKPNEFRLHVDGGGRRTPKDPRILNFRVFQVGTTPEGGG